MNKIIFSLMLLMSFSANAHNDVGVFVGGVLLGGMLNQPRFFSNPYQYTSPPMIYRNQMYQQRCDYVYMPDNFGNLIPVQRCY